MPEAINDSVRCGDCGFVFDGGGVDEYSGERNPCPECGSLKRNYPRVAVTSVTIVASAKGQVKRPSSKHKKNRPDLEFEGGRTVGRDGRPVFKTRVIDRRRPDSDGSYQELVIDEAAGNVIVDKHQKLSEHRRHRGAKPL